MTQQQLLDEYSALPDEAQRQVADFVAFLHQQYSASATSQQVVAIDLENEPFIGMWKDRTDLADSEAWVRATRRTEWSNGS